MTVTLQTLFGLTLCAVQAGLLIPLLRHAHTTRSAAGVSIPGEAAWCSIGAGWAGYGVASGSPVLILSGTLALLGCATLLWLLRAAVTTRQCRTGIITAGSVGAALVFAWCWGGVNGLATCLAVIGVVQFLPHLAAIVMLRGRPATGVSPTAAGLRSAYTGAWAVYACGWALAGVVAGVDWPLVTWGVSGALVFGLQAVLATRSGTGETLPGRTDTDAPADLP